MTGAIELQPDDGLRSSLSIGPGFRRCSEISPKFARRFAEGIGKFARNTPGDYRKKTRRLAERMSKAAGLAGQQSPLLLDRRDMLLGLGGLYGATAGPKVLANPIMPPDLSKCHDATAPALCDHCCPPYDARYPLDYNFPATPIRVRRPAHLVKDDQEYMDKYKEAVRRMKNLAEDHPWNYYQQANIHCQYCNDAYDQQNTDKVPVQGHFSWIFLPWHSYYLHCYERILGKLIDDDTFTIPFWN
ncbi:hypothetical protein GW17_00048274 [Ensete ventricosum]|nr:hypothetical protein GW17_00048274 [Ensete ventricosum]